MFRKLLIANRGEIACRVAATARRLSVGTVAVYSEADARARHVAVADEAVLLGPAPARESYLNVAAILEAARRTGADAVHPGYGFLSENAEFADACAKAGLIFIGPPASAIRAMGSKSAAKTLMEKAGVPLVPGYHGEDQAPELLAREAERIGFPVLIKASAGGGGKGMRIVETAADFGAALASCQREARSSFGDDKVLIERYLQRPRHIEVQVFADAQGHAMALFERDCSVQRRHQKVLEEAPAPGMTPARRSEMGRAAVDAARAVGYVGAGTVEFIADQDGTFYFMEMNTRLQVEHPVTEMITGEDLVEWQLRVAAGEPLPDRPLVLEGHAIEARLYAENPRKGFLPATGTLAHLRLPPGVEFQVAGPDGRRAPVRVDSGVRAGDTITPFYDPMIAKIIAWGEDRTTALMRLHQALNGTEAIGVVTNARFLARLLETRSFREADLDTGLIARHEADLLAPDPEVSAEDVALAAAALLLEEERRSGTSPWDVPRSWRLNGPGVRRLRFAVDGAAVTAHVTQSRTGAVLSTLGSEGALAYEARPDGMVAVSFAAHRFSGRAVFAGDAIHVFRDGRLIAFERLDLRIEAMAPEAEAGSLKAPMPGRIVAWHVAAGASVKAGTPLVVLEAMKMEHTLNAPADGRVTELLYAVGDQVTEGALLLGFEAEGAA